MLILNDYRRLSWWGTPKNLISADSADYRILFLSTAFASLICKQQKNTPAVSAGRGISMYVSIRIDYSIILSESAG
ncbi:hypothetical protein BH10BAC3_BH10BAC3_09750 [soil metagenome]